jgi:hypothetical protein
MAKTEGQPTEKISRSESLRRKKMNDFGIFAKDLMCKVTLEPTHRETVTSIPCSVGFKQKDGTWVNEFMDVVLFKDNFGLDDGIQKGDKIKVSGRMNLSEYKEKKKWSIFADEIKTDKKQESAPLDDDIPY